MNVQLAVVMKSLIRLIMDTWGKKIKYNCLRASMQCVNILTTFTTFFDHNYQLKQKVWLT